MHQVKVQILDPQPMHAGVECRQRALVALVGVPQLGDQVEFVSGHAGRGDCAAGFAFVAVHRRGVDMAVTGAQRGAHRLLGVCGRDLEYAESDGGNAITVVQWDQGA
jgi:hypothetical protein